MAVAASTYLECVEAIEYYEHWIDYWLGVREERPSKPRWMTTVDEQRIKVVTQSLVSTLQG
jgi:hypothetical protein